MVAHSRTVPVRMGGGHLGGKTTLEVAQNGRFLEAEKESINTFFQFSRTIKNVLPLSSKFYSPNSNLYLPFIFNSNTSGSQNDIAVYDLPPLPRSFPELHLSWWLFPPSLTHVSPSKSLAHALSLSFCFSENWD